LLPRLGARRVAEVDVPLTLARGEEDAPAIVGHLHVVVRGPALRVDADGGAQIDVVLLEAIGAHLEPPALEVRLPLLEGAEELAVGAEVHVVRNRIGEGHSSSGLQATRTRGPSRITGCTV